MTMNRRQYLEKFARSSILLFLGGTAGFLIYKKKVSLTGVTDCSFRCSDCHKLDGCLLPEAKKFRRNGKG